MTKHSKSRLARVLAGAALTAAAATVDASVIVLDFEGVGNNANINDFYNGGTDSLGNSGVDYGIQFGSNSLGLVDQDAGGGGNFANEPSSDTVMFFLTGTAVLNYTPGFDTGFSFFYSSSTTASVFVYDGLNATGNLLATLNLSAQHTDNCSGDPTGTFCNWTAVGASFAGTAYSIDFGGTVDQTGYDDITFGSADAGGVKVAEPSGLALLLMSLGPLAFSRARRKAQRRVA
ncbi:PEP-CTERM sorting domain-containing protein [Aestuariibacter sp. A3R04]|uniref:PEP-CTERM sorting domain-containing protein n=1 Tax=Aestuariibacter sp. A3R04 TaxID=2841571 RepID=UPI001C08D748|nr:PEP-CTERM sorting domain-containing protein [Aestuariibacter sp. A3R04]MBU3021089.1 PEP-CTERM sorting domain-containing protein [Aestuariibacter sp. A3R04]